MCFSTALVRAVVTVGTGQADHAVRFLVDMMVLIVPPDSADEIQATKAGILQLPDVYAGGKPDLPGVQRTAMELKWLAAQRATEACKPSVVVACTKRPSSFADLHNSIEDHRRCSVQDRDSRCRSAECPCSVQCCNSYHKPRCGFSWR
jgi:putative protein kinase ArgK-like GTPase of G3E family